ncbi:hypothetical protein H5410_033548 [Solanum commersonii]|uniref:Uncharacterized protein n=1 Tax=Solanum commersonii TaxID=4109 RepID=A0A9J5YNY4_SOLCO|nr:hypothetical protein H5410_033548 [Solanum commersonii]
MDSFISSRNNVMKSVKEWSPRTNKPLMSTKGTTTRLVNESYFKTSDIGIEDTIVDNREDNGVDKNILIEGNSTKVVLQGIRGDVTNEVDAEFSDPDYNLSDEDDDFRDVIDDQQVLIDDQQVLVDDQQVLVDDQQVKKLRGRPKNASVNVPVSSEILVPLQNADVESDYAYSDELPDDDIQFDKGENNGQKNNIYEEYDEGKNKNLPRFALGMNLQYGKLLSYRAELLRSNPGSNVVIWRDGRKFLGFYVCLGALKEAFKSGCRPLISLDGLIGAVKDLFPEAEHRNCDLIWNAVRASNKVIFQKCMEALDQEDKAAREWFSNPERPFQSWTRALFRTNTKCDMLLNNLYESFNRYILDARDKTIITMLEMIKKTS